MGAPSPAPGWYPDVTGTPRYFDGTQWTAHIAPRMSPEQRQDILQREIRAAVARGGRVESQTQTAAVIVYGRPVNHVVHAILTVFTCFIWLIVWAIDASNGGERRDVIEVDPWGRAATQWAARAR